MASMRSACSESSEMLTRRTPAAFRSSASGSSSTALVDRAMSSMPGTAAMRATREGSSRRTSGSPPVMRTRRRPMPAIVVTICSISS
jgi:hypothetical protein